MTQLASEKITFLPLDNFQVILLLDTLKDIINKNGEIDVDLKDYLTYDNNPYEMLYNELLNEYHDNN